MAPRPQTGDQSRQLGVNKFLAAISSILCIMAGYALYKNLGADLILGLAFLGTASAVMSAFEPRMIGKFSFSPKSLDFNLTERRAATNSIMEAERELRKKELIPLAEVVTEDD